MLRERKEALLKEFNAGAPDDMGLIYAILERIVTIEKRIDELIRENADRP